MTRSFSPLSHCRGPDSTYDAVIIGSGIGGLVCANLLARSGLKVLLVEQHTMVGGYCSGFRRKGFLFDAASHFYPLLGNPGSISGRLLSELNSNTQWVKMDPVDQYHLPDGTRFSVPADFQTYLARLKSLFPDEARALDDFFQLTRKLYLWGILHFFLESDAQRIEPYLGMTVREALDRHFLSPKLKLLLTADCPHWGSPPSQTSFVFDSMLRLSYFEGNFFPRGGSQAFSDDLASQFVLQGGHVLTGAMVRRIIVQQGRATAIEIESGPRKSRRLTRVAAAQVVSNADMRQTVLDLVGHEYFPDEYVSRLKQLRPSFPCFLAHIGVRSIARELLEEVHGYYWREWDSDRVGVDAFEFKLFVPTLYDPSLAPEGSDVVIVQKVTQLDYDSVSDWTANKREIEHSVIARLNRLVPGFRDRVVVCESASAYTSHRFTMNYQGAMLGWKMSPDQLGLGRPANESPVPNLFFVGQWTRPGGGITPAVVSAINVANRICGGRRRCEARDVARPSTPAAIAVDLSRAGPTHCSQTIEVRR